MKKKNKNMKHLKKFNESYNPNTKWVILLGWEDGGEPSLYWAKDLDEVYDKVRNLIFKSEQKPFNNLYAVTTPVPAIDKFQNLPPITSFNLYDHVFSR